MSFYIRYYKDIIIITLIILTAFISLFVVADYSNKFNRSIHQQLTGTSYVK